MLTLSVVALLESLAKIGANITQDKRDLLKWRFSEEGMKYYTLKETNRLYKAIEKGNVDLIDVIRKEKQAKINELLKAVSILLLMFTVSCNSIPFVSKEHLDTASLKATEKTYVVDQTKAIKTTDGSKIFDGSWYVVHKDVIKDMNNNQDNLIKQLEENKKQKNTLTITKIISATGISLSLILFILLIVLIKKRR